MSLDLSTCQYTDGYHDIRTGDYRDYQCGRIPLSTGGLCEFHDKKYFQTHQNEVRQKFLDELNSSASTLFFIGCHIPDVNINELSSDSCVYFVNAKFHGPVSFSDVQFLSVNFRLAKFYTRSKFHNFNISEFFDFSDVIYEDLESSNAEFSNSDFNGQTKFTRTHFPSTAFVECNFNGTNFRKTEFHHGLMITKCSFLSQSDFSASSFNKETLFLFSAFHSNVLFGHSKFKNIVEFQNINFKKQSLVTFNGNLSNVSFLETDITRIKFDERIIWGDLDRYSIFDARRLIETPEKYGLSSVLAVYRNLRENYEYRMMYEEAGQFFVKEMELKRNYFEDSNNEYKTKEKSCWHRKFSLNSWYSYLCKYGESFSRPFLWSGVIFFLAGIYYWCNPDLSTIRENHSLNSIDDVSALLEVPGMKLKITVERTLAAFFQIDSNELVDYLVRLVSIPILGTLFIVFRRRFERRFRH